MNSLNEEAEVIGRRWFQSLVVAAALLAYFAQPLLTFADNGSLLNSAALIAAGATGIATFLTEKSYARSLVWLVGAIGLIGWGVVGAVLAMTTAMNLARSNDQRCMALQIDMLSAHPRIASGPDKFQALGCRPQGYDTRIFVPPTDRERAAGKPLSWGGYPPPR